MRGLIATAMVGLAVLAAAPARAQVATPSAPAKSCADAHTHELDFWVGDWEIRRTSDGKVTGHSHVERLYGCVLHEDWTGLTETGGSLNAYDQASHIWRRLWAGLTGNVGDYTGGWAGDHMEFVASSLDKGGKPLKTRLRLYPQADGSIHQLLEDSSDGAVWKPVVDSIYRRSGKSGVL